MVYSTCSILVTLEFDHHHMIGRVWGTDLLTHYRVKNPMDDKRKDKFYVRLTELLTLAS